MSEARRLFAWENVALTVICLADMISTLYWVHAGVAQEDNPIFAAWLPHGDFAFCTMKLLSFLPLILLATYYRPRRPRLIKVAMRATLFLYITMYTGRFAAQALLGV